MSTLNAILLGLIQGLTEFLPISSSAHISIFGQLMGTTNPGAAFTAIIQIGTETAVLLYFRRDIWNILSAWFACLFGRNGKDLQHRLGSNNVDARMGWYIIMGSLPIVILGVLFDDAIETYLRNLWITATMLIVFAIILYIADTLSRQNLNNKDLNTARAIVYGIAQALAVIPGVSRSGGVISAGLFMNFSRVSAAKYAFLLAMPAVFGSGVYELIKAVMHNEYTAALGFPGWGPTVIATLVAFIVGYLVIIAFLKIISTYSYKLFSYYRLVLGIAVIIMLLTGVLQ
ncbi:MAG: undecaprenyl-diphosphate phosphatase [Bifidobacteriaceae bacterium]|nr:undecaprenyl-diphosphate phosphatase [Bifidobacteriaceae bacterium]